MKSINKGDPNLNRMNTREWYDWITEDRLARWNHLRDRSMMPLLTRMDAAVLAAQLPAEAKTELKDRIE